MGPLTEKVFIERTKEIIKQYKAFEDKKEDYYDVTLLINCLLGLIFIPRQKISFNINKFKNPVPDAIKDTLVSIKDKSGNDTTILFNEYIIGLRNALAHMAIGDEQSTPFVTNVEKTVTKFIITGILHENQPDKKVITYKFDVTEENNKLGVVIDEVLNFIYPKPPNDA
jgi:hypothetical protein